ncbi:hypothetical protein J5Y04_37225 [Kitasatospora sp. RG8]|uniref:hypothetical protein n=1 Tax=Kitasatospora sp. RG8 TaxID=2820815 RepID=UPI001AE06045|nr:hypothetical protein [Kitasatospora sp. RG8]MBP0455119.1 hypothetical protein [Kitasatospora sp. RG8]
MTENIDQLLGTVDGLDPALLTSLDDADRGDLLSRALSADDPDRPRAMALLARADPSPDGPLAQAVQQAVTDADPFVAAAGLSLAACLGNGAVPVVQGAASSADPVTALTAWGTLQQIARSDVLDDLRQLAPPPGDAVGDQAAFALSVIASRAGLTGFELTPPDETAIRAIDPGAQPLSPITASAPTDDDFALLRTLTEGELYLMSPAQRASLAIDCGEHLLLCIDPDIQDGLPDTLLQAPALAGLVAVRDQTETSYSVRHLVLTQPDGAGSIHVLLCDPGGAQAFYGPNRAVQIADGTVTFPLFAVDGPGVGPIALTVTASTAGVSLGGDLVVLDDILTDRLDPEAD